jgi:hypothetical protein
MIEPEREDAVLEIVGESNYQPALERLSGGKTPDGTRVAGGMAILFPEPQNPYDSNAIAVRTCQLITDMLCWQGDR